jgi:cytidylate kinase
MVIRVSGYPGSGKTTLCKRLAEALGYQYHYAGGIFREMAKEKGMSIEDFYKALDKDPELEKSIDAKQEEIMCKSDNQIMEGRYAPFQPCPFDTRNVLVMVEPSESARRGLLRPENAGRSLADMQRQTEERVLVERKRFNDLYGIENHLDPKHFDIVIDTTGLTSDQTFEKVMSELKH